MASDNAPLGRVRKLLAKAEANGVTPAEAEAFTAKAAELVARYGIDRALLAAERPETDQPGDRVLDVHGPWARVQAHLLCGLAAAMRCQCVILPGRGPGSRIHMFGFASDIERTDMLYTSLLVQMWQGLAAADVPSWTRSPRAWRRSWLLGFVTAVLSRVRDAEQQAASQATAPAAASGSRGLSFSPTASRSFSAGSNRRTRAHARHESPTAAAVTGLATPRASRLTSAAIGYAT